MNNNILTSNKRSINRLIVNIGNTMGQGMNGFIDWQDNSVPGGIVVKDANPFNKKFIAN